MRHPTQPRGSQGGVGVLGGLGVLIPALTVMTARPSAPRPPPKPKRVTRALSQRLWSVATPGHGHVPPFRTQRLPHARSRSRTFRATPPATRPRSRPALAGHRAAAQPTSAVIATTIDGGGAAAAGYPRDSGRFAVAAADARTSTALPLDTRLPMLLMRKEKLMAPARARADETPRSTCKGAVRLSIGTGRNIVTV